MLYFCSKYYLNNKRSSILNCVSLSICHVILGRTLKQLHITNEHLYVSEGKKNIGRNIIIRSSNIKIGISLKNLTGQALLYIKYSFAHSYQMFMSNVQVCLFFVSTAGTTVNQWQIPCMYKYTWLMKPILIQLQDKKLQLCHIK